ncbi:hypothetical protein C8J56DRAFT_1040372 [Mycena floridula]|nr:hypothetical protein C8J56DRAFT_1040372 [Mycena floridula]
MAEVPTIKFFPLVSLPTKVFNLVLCHLPISDIGVLRQSSSYLARMCSSYTALAFDINRKLQPFFANDAVVSKFRRQLNSSGALIGGSFALQYFTRSEFPTSDLDIYVYLGRAESLIEFCLHAGFRDCPRPGEFHRWTERLDDYEEREEQHDGSIKGVINLFNEDGKKMQIIIAQKTPTDAILSYHSTSTLMTFVHERNLVTGKLRDKFVPLMAISKYEQRGYRSVTTLDPTHNCQYGTFHCGTRRIGDRHTWVITFPDASEKVCDPYEGNLWHLRKPDSADFHPFVQVCKPLLKHDRLLFQYTSTCAANPLRTLRDLRRQQINDVGYFRYDKEFIKAMNDWIEDRGGTQDGTPKSSDDESNALIEF